MNNPLRIVAAAAGVAFLAIGLTGCTADEPEAPPAEADEPSSAAEESPSAPADPLETLADTWMWVPEEGTDMATLTLVIDADGNVEYTGVGSSEGTLVPGDDDTHQIEIAENMQGEPETWEAVYDPETDTLEVDLTYAVEPFTAEFSREA
ncbi:hypothetical protein [Glycomyces buryatensis]|uniref:Lipoprotein n=1 Tax=Glycomyces buryatensis TaxID=2570927 RepID=A0A4S8QKP8_9ACTN|nr:hypothetical protein [Glycomyces buryatensis]THV43575.1 hypothetical protein FAB82_00520 [Glycomyces buryatensis]